MYVFNSITIDSAKDKSFLILQNRPTPSCLVFVGFLDYTKV